MDKYVIAPPSGSTNNSVGAVDRPWKEGHFEKLPNWQEYLAESTGYGIVSGCAPSISGLTVTVGAGVVHLADGTRKEIAATNITLDNADGTNPRIDLVYIDSTGAVAKVTGTAAASPSAPALPSGGISVCNVTIAAGASTGTINRVQTIAPNLANYNIVNVKDFGAKGDGITDDTAAIQVAIDTGSVVLFPDGNYLLSSFSYGNEKIELVGIGKNSVLVHNDNSDLFTLTACKVVCKNIKIIGTSSGVAFKSTGTEFVFDNVAVEGLASAILQSSSGNTTSSIKNEIKNCKFITSSYGIQYYGNLSYVDFVMSDCYIKTTNNAPYFISGCKYATVIRGEYTSDNASASPNLYSNNNSDILGGYYHDMHRGATIGGRDGKRGTIIATKNENTGFSGISVDLATGHDDLYTEGQVVVSANIINNCKYGIYVQGKKILITSNVITMASDAQANNYAIRFNCTLATAVDCGSEISNNIIDCSGAQVYPIYLGKRTVLHEYNNVVINSVTSKNYQGAEGAVYYNGRIVNVNSTFTINAQNKLYYCSELSNSIYGDVPNSDYASCVGYEFTIVNGSDKSITIMDQSGISSFKSNTGDTIVPANSICHLLCYDINKWTMETVSLS